MGIGVISISTNAKRDAPALPPPFPANAAENGLSVDSITGRIVLGNDVGDVTQPAALLSNRELPLALFTLHLLGAVGAQAPFVSFEHANNSDTFIELVTLQGAAFGNYYLTLDETTINPDTQRDAVMHLGYNITGAGGRRNPAEPSVHDAWESHFDPGTGIPQMERHIEYSLPTGELARVISWQMRTTAPLFALVQHRAAGWTFASTDDADTVMTFDTTGAFNLYGTGTTAFIRINNRTDLTTGTIQSEGGVIYFDTNGVHFDFRKPVAIEVNVNAPTTVLTLQNNDVGTDAQVIQEFVTARASHCQIGLIGPNHPSVPNYFFFHNTNPTGVTAFSVNSVRNLAMIAGGLTGVGFDAPTASLHIKPGTASANGAPLKFTSGTNTTTAETGAVEYNGTNLFFTRTGTTRESIFTGVSGAAAPGTTAGVAIANFYGTAATNYLGDPNSWASVVIGGATFKIPLYT
jgi:hypothetical protein